MKTDKCVYMVGLERPDGTIKICSPCYVKRFAAELRLQQLPKYGVSVQEKRKCRIYEATDWQVARGE